MLVSCQLNSMKLAVVLTTLITLLRAVIVCPPAALAQRSRTADPDPVLCNPDTFSSDDGCAVRNLDEVAESLIQSSSQFLYSMASSETGSRASYVYGMYQCRGDLSLSNCSSCVIHALTAFGKTGMAALCTKGAQAYSHQGPSLARGAQAYYQTGCYLRYETYEFFTAVNEEDGTSNPPHCFCSSMEYSSSLYQQNVQTALNDSAAAAPKHALFGYNATSVGSGSSTAYVLTQCLGYLNPSQCAACLSHVSNNTVLACNRSVSGKVFFNGCYYLFANTSFVHTSGRERSKNHTAAIVGIVAGVCVVLAGLAALLVLKRQNKLVKLAREIYKAQDPFLHTGEQPLNKPGAKGFSGFSLKELQDATYNFHPNNKLGEGGYGPVYQGKLKSGLEVAIKMLSARSHQGTSEFINEVSLITTVQHRNLIQLIGCCVDGRKPLLVYEYLPNRSLDLHLFGANENNALDWHTRFNIIVGIVRGLRYLHEDSPVRIVHRDIKASNILLDNDFNPKIADFGLARLIADDRSHLTTRVAGTLGYLAPEYVINGQLTEKADVYSFGLMALEIVSGRKVVEPTYEANKKNLLDWAWSLYEKQQHLEIVDARMQKAKSSSDATVSMRVNVEEAIRVVHVALLCTQLQPQARPSMSEVHNMLCGQAEIVNLPTKRMTIGMPSPITDILHDGRYALPLWTSQPSDQPTRSQDADLISQVEPR